MCHRAVWVTGFRSKFVCAADISTAGPAPSRAAVADTKEQCLATSGSVYRVVRSTVSFFLSCTFVEDLTMGKGED